MIEMVQWWMDENWEAGKWRQARTGSESQADETGEARLDWVNLMHLAAGRLWVSSASVCGEENR